MSLLCWDIINQMVQGQTPVTGPVSTWLRQVSRAETSTDPRLYYDLPTVYQIWY